MPLIISSSCFSEDGSSQLLFNPADFNPKELLYVIDADRCIGCRACEVHCWNEHRSERMIGESSIRVVHVDKNLNDAERVVGYFPQTCAHCKKPECVDICPAGAIRKEENGIVRVFREKCIGCKSCSTVCPNYYFKFSDKSRRTLKCDGCLPRIKEGYWPACATKCSMKAIYIGFPDEIAHILREKKAGGDKVYIIGDAVEGRDVG